MDFLDAFADLNSGLEWELTTPVMQQLIRSHTRRRAGWDAPEVGEKCTLTAPLPLLERWFCFSKFIMSLSIC